MSAHEGRHVGAHEGGPVSVREGRRSGGGPVSFAVGVAVALAAGCGVLTEPELQPQPSIVVTAEPVFLEILADVDEIGLRVTPPGAAARDTIVRPLVGRGTFRVRTSLRPGEGLPGTAVELELRADGRTMFRGRVVFSEATGWPAEAQVALEPVATLDAGSNWELMVGERVPLADIARITFADGRWLRPSGVVWSSRQPSIVSIEGGEFVTVGVGSTIVAADWLGQADTFRVDVHPPGRILVTDSFERFHLGASEVLTDSVLVAEAAVGGVGQLSASVDASTPWLSAVLRPGVPPAWLVVSVDGASLAPGGNTGDVAISSNVPGVADLVVSVTAERDPSVGVESMSWAPFCLITERVSGGQAGVYGCIELHARAWTDGSMRRVVLEARNLQGSVGDTLDTAPGGVKLSGYGILPTGMSGTVELIGVRGAGQVGVVGTPAFRLDRPSEFALQAVPSDAAIVGCQAFSSGNYFSTCAPDGYTGVVRADFRVDDLGWSLGAASVFMDMAVAGVVAVDRCVLTADGACVIVP